VIVGGGGVGGVGGVGAAGIVGVGVDAVSVDRFRRLLERRPRFAARCFAARFAAKEAVMKALGTGIGAFALTDVEVCRTVGTDATRNAPYVVLTGKAAELAWAHGASRFHLSLTHTDDVAIAFVVAEQGGPAQDGAASASASAAVAAGAGSAACAPS
jgi:holo-[acyl-carrier protein] synthase